LWAEGCEVVQYRLEVGKFGWVFRQQGNCALDYVELVLIEGWFHILDAVDVGQPGDMVKEGWCRPGVDFLVDLEGCAAAVFPGVEYIVGGDGALVFESLDEKGGLCGGAPWAIPRVGSRCIGK
jgi:hypothetical protein